MKNPRDDLMALADRIEKSISVEYYHKTLSNNQLIRWYNKNGFKVDNLLHDMI